MIKCNDPEDYAYTQETRERIIKLYMEDLSALSESAREVFKTLQEKGHITEMQFRIALLSVVTGAFIIGFKQGNDMFLKEAEEKKS